MTRLTSRFMRPADADLIASVQQKLRGAGLVSVEDPILRDRIQSVRRSVDSIRTADEEVTKTLEQAAAA